MSDEPVDVGWTDFPGLYRAAGELSAEGQRRHLANHRLLLSLLLGAAALTAAAVLPEAVLRGGWAGCRVPSERFLSGGVALAMALGLWFTAELKTEKAGDDWYDGRALAESTKSMAWKYMMKAEPYDASHAEARKRLCDDLAKLLTDGGQTRLPAPASSGEQITAKMDEVRNLPWRRRLSTYLTHRVRDQAEWYRRRAGDHRRSWLRWHRSVVVCNLLALVAALVSVVWLPALGLAGLFVTASSCSLTWARLNRFQDLAHSYAWTHQEIGLLESRGGALGLETELAQFISDCETAFSREHSMWRARRQSGGDPSSI